MAARRSVSLQEHTVLHSRWFAYTLMRVRDPTAAEDLVQETLLAAMMSVDRFRGAEFMRHATRAVDEDQLTKAGPL